MRRDFWGFPEVAALLLLGAGSMAKPARFSVDEWRRAVTTGQTLVRGNDFTIYKQFEVDPQVLEGRRVRFTITTADVDRDRDVVNAEGVEVEAFLRNPVVLFAHDYHALPIARAVQIERQPGKLIAETEFATAELNPMAEQVYRMVKAGFLRAASIGFRPLEWSYDEERKGVNFERVELLEYSIVPVPANAMALVAASADFDAMVLRAWAEQTLDGLDKRAAGESLKVTGDHADEKGVSPKDVSTANADEATAWTAPSLSDFTGESWGDLGDAQKRAIAGHYAWAAMMPPDAFDDLKLPHHRPSDGAIVWRGVAASAARLSQADIPEADLDKVKAHLRRHYEAFEKPVPDLLKTPPSLVAKDRIAAQVATALSCRMAEMGPSMWPIPDDLRPMVAACSELELDVFADQLAAAEDDAESARIVKSWAKRKVTPKAAVTLDATAVAEMVDAKLSELRQELSVVDAELKRGRVLSTRNEDTLRTAKEQIAAGVGRIDEVLSAIGEEEIADGLVLDLADGDEVVLDLSDEDDADRVTVDPDMIAAAIRTGLTAMVERETRAAVNALRGRID